MENEYKKRYYKLLRDLRSLHHRLVYDRCPAFKQCCAACNTLDELIKLEKKKDGEDGTGSNESDG